MNYTNWLLWLGGTLLPLGLLWALWRLALRPERCYGYNRALLLLAPLLAAALPLLPRPVLPAWLAGAVATSSPVAAVTLPVLPIGATAPHAAVVASGLWLLALYGVGVALGLGKLAWQTGRLWQLARRLPRFEQSDYVLVQTGGILPTSTFGQVVFWDETTALAPAEATAVLAHELAHARQHHTLDVVWLQLWRAVLWPNPFVHLLLPALRLTHELLADQAANTAPATPHEPYPTLLARLAARQMTAPAYSLLQPFAFSSTLTRIAMLKTQVPVRRWKQWLVLPTLGGLFVVACQSAPQPAMAPPPPPTLATPEKMPQLPGGGGTEALIKAIQERVVYPQLPKDERKEGKELVAVAVSPTGRARILAVEQSIGPAYDEAVRKAIEQLPTLSPGILNGKPVDMGFVIPVLFEVQ